jgi:ferredoxin--NADP+ reductase
MNEIISKQNLTEEVKRMDIYAPLIAQKAQPGQFVSLCPQEGAERIPLCVIDSDPHKGTITIIFREIGSTTKMLGELAIRDSIFSILGPLGNPAKVKKIGTVVCVGVGIGCAQILPIAKAHKRTGNKVIGILGAKTKRLLLVENQMRISCDRIHFALEQGGYDRAVAVAELLKKVLDENPVEFVYVSASTEVMKSVCALTRARKIKTSVQLHPVMVDCMGMCGSCRVKVGGEEVLACVEGPEFDGHKVDFEDFAIRMKSYEEFEQWNNRKWLSSQKKRESKTFTKLLSGILKK